MDIVTQTHIVDGPDIQGGLYPEQKQDVIDISVRSLRNLNPNNRIILVGHGNTRPFSKTIDLVDCFVWEKSLPLDDRGCVIGQPAQYKNVYKGIKQVQSNWCLKTRADCVIGIPNICAFCKEITDKENTDLLVTQMTSRKTGRLGDCFMFGMSGRINNIWYDRKDIYNAEDGTYHIGTSFWYSDWISDENELTEETWLKLLKESCSFRNVTTLKFMDLRYNYRQVLSNRESIIDGSFDYENWYWGKTNGWFSFDENGRDLIGFDGYGLCEFSFYEKK